MICVKLFGDIMKNLNYFVFVLFLLGSINVFAQWEQLAGLPTGPITDLLNANKRVYAVAWTAGLYVSSDYGDNWVQQNEGLTTTFVKCIAEVDTFLLIGTTDTSGVFRSSNKGFTWTPSNDSLVDRQIVTFVVDDKVVYLLTESSLIYKSSDLGVTWSRIETEALENKIITSFAVSNSRILVGTSTGDLFISTNDGDTWTNIKDNQFYSPITSLFWDGDDIYCGTQVGLFFSSNFGQNWFQRNVGLKTKDITLLKKVQNALLLGTRTGGVYFSLDKGRSWFEFNEGLPDLSVLSLSFDEYYIYVGTEYGSVARRRLSELTIPEVQAPILTYPPNGAKNVEKVVSFAWEASKGATSYHIIVAKDESFSLNSIVIDKNGITNTYLPSVYLQPNRQYYWKVAAVDYLSQEKWSNVFTFETIFEPIKPILYFPFNNFETNLLPIQFLWSDVGFVENYQLQIANSNDFKNLIVDITTKDTSYKVSQGIENNQIYFWRVAAKYNDTTIVVSDTFSFRTTVLSVEQNEPSIINWRVSDTKLIVELPETKTGQIYAIEIFDVIGKSVLFGWFEAATNNNSVEISLSNLPSGVYYFYLFSKESSFGSWFVLLR